MSNNSRAKEYGITATKEFADYIDALKSENFEEIKDWYGKANTSPKHPTFAKFLQEVDEAITIKKKDKKIMCPDMELVLNMKLGSHANWIGGSKERVEVARGVLHRLGVESGKKCDGGEVGGRRGGV